MRDSDLDRAMREARRDAFAYGVLRGSIEMTIRDLEEIAHAEGVEAVYASNCRLIIERFRRAIEVAEKGPHR